VSNFLRKFFYYLCLHSNPSIKLTLGYNLDIKYSLALDMNSAHEKIIRAYSQLCRGWGNSLCPGSTEICERICSPSLEPVRGEVVKTFSVKAPAR
jgi:hypothetical protein